MKTKQLPKGWKEVELGNEEYFKILSSGINKFDGEKDYLSTESIKETKINKIECIISYANRPSRANMQPVLNSVWFAKMQATLKVYAFISKNKNEIDKYILSTGFAGIRVNEDLVFPEYLRLLLISKDFNEWKDKLCTGSTQRGINNQFIKKISLVIPPLETQKAIVSILEKAEKAKEWRKKADKLTDDYLKSVFYEMFLKKYDVVFDNNLIIDLEEKRDGWENIQKLQELETKEKLKINIPVIVGSEKKIDGSFIINYYKFIDFIKNQGFKESTKLKPLCILGLCYNNFSLLSNKKMANKLEEIFYFLFPDREFDYSTFCKNKGIDPKIKPLHKNWKRYIIDAMLLWSCDYYKIPYLVTRDKHFLNKKEEIKQKYNIEILEPKELILEIEKRNFEKVELGNKNLFEIQSGGTPSRTKKEYWNNGKIPWIGSTACKDFPISKSKQFITEKGLKNSSTRLFPKNTILVALVGATIGKTGILKFECATNQNIAGINIKDKKRIDKIYLFFMLQSLYHKFLSLSSDSFKMANLSFVRSLKIPLPPISLQNKFASIVKEVEAIKEHQKKSREEINNLFNALMQKAFRGELKC